MNDRQCRRKYTCVARDVAEFKFDMLAIYMLCTVVFLEFVVAMGLESSSDNDKWYAIALPRLALLRVVV